MKFSIVQSPGYFGSLLAAASLLVAPACLAELKVGDAAPAMKAGKWLQGDAVTQFEGDKVYIVEFWATWCGPCKASIPHINDLHERFKDKGLVIIGQNVWEQDDSLAATFVQSMAGKMNYRVAADDKSDGGKGQMAKSWLTAAGQNGIPCAFIINKKGHIVYIDHPMSIKEEALAAWLDEPSTAPPPAAKSRTADTSSAPSAKAQELIRRAEAAIHAGDWDQADAAVAELQDALTDNFRDLGGLLTLDLLLARQQADDALQLTKMLCEDFKDKPAVLNAIAAHLVMPAGAQANVLAAAEKIATPLSTTAGAGSSAALATLARIAWLRGDPARAVGYQKRAVAQAPQADIPRLQAILAEYQNKSAPK